MAKKSTLPRRRAKVQAAGPPDPPDVIASKLRQSEEEFVAKQLAALNETLTALRARASGENEAPQARQLLDVARNLCDETIKALRQRKVEDSESIRRSAANYSDWYRCQLGGSPEGSSVGDQRLYSQHREWLSKVVSRAEEERRELFSTASNRVERQGEEFASFISSSRITAASRAREAISSKVSIPQDEEPEEVPSEAPPSEDLTDIIQGDWVVEMLSPWGTVAAGEFSIHRDLFRRPRFHARTIVGPEWHAEGTWETLPDQRLSLEGKQRMEFPVPQEYPYRLYVAFAEVKHDNLTGVTATQERCVWRRRET